MALLLFVALLTVGLRAGKSETAGTGVTLAEIEDRVREVMEKDRIPGLSLVVIRGQDQVLVRGFGYTDPGKRLPVDADTPFELGSCSKAFTALAVLHLEEKGLLKRSDPVSVYFPWFAPRYKGERYEITLQHLLQHTSGIPWHTISIIPRGNAADALVQTVRKVAAVELNRVPGKQYEYATVNYDILGAVIEKVSGRSFEDYMAHYVFQPLGLIDTSIGVVGRDQGNRGYKTGFFAPRPYEAPVYRGNFPAGYVISTGSDMARWLSIQLGLTRTPLDPLIRQSHTPNLFVAVKPESSVSYNMGWNFSNRQGEKIAHAGLNPNFSAYIGFKPKAKIGVAILANSDTHAASMLGEYLLKAAAGEEAVLKDPAKNKVDVTCSIASLVLAVYLLLLGLYLGLKLLSVLRGKSPIAPMSWKKVGRIFLPLLVAVPYLWGIYLLPTVVARLSWGTVLVWAPLSVSALVTLLAAAGGATYVVYFFSLFCPARSKYRKTIPVVIILSMMSGFTGIGVILVITSSFFSDIPLKYLLFYFVLILAMNLLGDRLARKKMIYLTRFVTYDMRVDLISRIMASKYQDFEKIMDGRIFTTLNGDINVLAGSAGMVIGLVTSLVNLVAGFVYLSIISLAATVVVLLLAAAMAVYYYLVSQKARVYMEEVRSIQNIYMSLLNGLIKGYKELSIHRKKKNEYFDDLIEGCVNIRDKRIISSMKFLNSGVIGGAFSMIVIGLVSIVVPRVLTTVDLYTLISFVMVVLYLRGPIAGLLGVIPAVTSLKVSWGRIKQLNREIDGTTDYSVLSLIKKIDRPGQIDVYQAETEPLPPGAGAGGVVESIKVEGLRFKYESDDEDEPFELGPVDFEVRQGEILFLTGGNGSGKTTLIKLLAGLYLPAEGTIKINGQPVPGSLLGEYFSVIFSDYHLFKRLYSIDVREKRPEIVRHLDTLKLKEKVQLDEEDRSFSTLNLSGGQRKRLALLQSYLEDCPIKLFDEVAADQDPVFRKFFYRDLLTRMKQEGKVVIVASHDDHYFDAADKLIKLDMGKIDAYEDLRDIRN
jgi:cyclic peptide transporter